MKKIFALILVVFMVIGLMVGCTQADIVSQNLSKEADNFNVARKLSVINIRTDTVLFQMIGNFSINIDSDGDLNVIGENANGTYYKHFVSLPKEVTYIVEDLGTTMVDRYNYQINFNPKMILPVEVSTID